MFWRAEKPKYRVVYYGPYWNYVVEQSSFGIFGRRWCPVKAFDFENWPGSAAKYCNGDTVEKALRHLRECIATKNREKNQAAARRSFAMARSEAKKTVVLDEFSLE